MELIDFYYFNSPATLRVHGKDKQFDMKFHTIDQWGTTLREKVIRNWWGIRQVNLNSCQGTLEIPEAVLKSSDRDIKDTIDRYFRRFNLEAFAFQSQLTTRKFSFKAKLSSEPHCPTWIMTFADASP